MKSSLINILLSITIFASCKPKESNTTDDFEFESINDYVSDIDEFLYERATESLFKIVMDINGDKREDILLSGYYKGGWGNSGGEWTVYLNGQSNFMKCDKKFVMYPNTARLDPKESSILTYGRLGCCDGSLNQIKLNDCNIKNTLIEKYETDSDIENKINQHFTGLTEFVTYKAQINADKETTELKWERWE